MKKVIIFLMSLTTVLVLAACGSRTNYEGTYTGYSWQGEANGVSFEDATQYIETKLTLDKDGIIVAAEIDFRVIQNGEWVSRKDSNVQVSVDFSIDPLIADPRVDGRSEGTSMFDIQAVDFMSLYVVAVDTDGTVAFGLVCPVTRYLFEIKLDSDFDFSTAIKDITIASGDLVPTRLTSGGSLIRPNAWSVVEENNLFNMHRAWSHVINDVGVFEGLTEDSSIQELLEAAGVTFTDGVAQSKDVSFDFFGLGGWAGNLNAIAQNLVGIDAKEFTGIIDWSIEKYALGINENNVFGVDAPVGATRTVQDSIDGIFGATVRVSREATSIQRALVEAGVLSEDDVIIGRF